MVAAERGCTIQAIMQYINYTGYVLFPYCIIYIQLVVSMYKPPT